jgi:RNA polymerase sigma-70 factor, ECF subfamily
MSDAASRVARAALPHLDAAYNLARWLVRDPHAAEDVVQDAFARAMTYAGGLRDENPRAWLLAIVRGVAYDRLARERRLVPLGEEAHAELPDPEPGPEDEAMRRELSGRLGELLERLPPEWRECIVLREIEEMSYRDIARVAGVPVGTVMSRLFRARQALARQARELVR